MMFEVDLDTLRKSLQGSTPVSFSYFKKNGECRQAVGTLHPHLIPKEHRIDEKEGESKKTANFAYFDLEKNAWRSLHKDCQIVTMIE